MRGIFDQARGGCVLLAVVCAMLAATAGAQGAAVGQDQPGIDIARPEEGSIVSGGHVAVALQVRGAQLGGRSRNGAFVLLTLDAIPPVKSYAERFTFTGVETGAHVLTAELRRPDGAAFSPPVRDTVRFEVRAGLGSSHRRRR